MTHIERHVVHVPKQTKVTHKLKHTDMWFTY